VFIFAGYLLMFIIGGSLFTYTYTYEWAMRNLLFPIAIISIAFAVFNKLALAIMSATGLPIGIILGELIGSRLYSIDVLRHEEMALQANYVQQSMPHHYGWLICIITYLMALVVGFAIQMLYKKRIQKLSTCSENWMVLLIAFRIGHKL